MCYQLHECIHVGIPFEKGLRPSGFVYLQTGKWEAVRVFISKWLTFKRADSLNPARLANAHADWNCRVKDLWFITQTNKRVQMQKRVYFFTWTLMFGYEINHTSWAMLFAATSTSSILSPKMIDNEKLAMKKNYITRKNKIFLLNVSEISGSSTRGFTDAPRATCHSRSRKDRAITYSVLRRVVR